MTGSICFYSKDEATNFNSDIEKTDYFKSFKYKDKLLENTVTQLTPSQTNGFLKNATTAVPLKYSSNFWRTLEILLINCRNELKLKWTKYCIFSANGNENTNNNPNNILFTIKDSNIYVSVVTLSAKDNQKLSKLLLKVFQISVYWNEYKAKKENKNTTNEYRYFLESKSVGVNRLFVLVYSNKDDNVTRFKTRRYYLPKGIIDNYNVIINGKNFYDQPIN